MTKIRKKGYLRVQCLRAVVEISARRGSANDIAARSTFHSSRAAQENSATSFLRGPGR